MILVDPDRLQQIRDEMQEAVRTSNERDHPFACEDTPIIETWVAALDLLLGEGRRRQQTENKEKEEGGARGR